MNQEMLLQRLKDENDIGELRRMAMLLSKCISSDGTGGGYCVVNDHDPQNWMFRGSRDNCLAFVEGYEAAPLTDVGCFDNSTLCVCVDVPSLMIVVPEDRFGENLGKVEL